jgi:hypothetical protein
MLKIFNSFLNTFENFCWRLLIAVLFLIAIPFVAILFVFGFFSLQVSKETARHQNNEQ